MSRAVRLLPRAAARAGLGIGFGAGLFLALDFPDTEIALFIRRSRLATHGSPEYAVENGGTPCPLPCLAPFLPARAGTTASHAGLWKRFRAEEEDWAHGPASIPGAIGVRAK